MKHKRFRNINQIPYAAFSLTFWGAEASVSWSLPQDRFALAAPTGHKGEAPLRVWAVLAQEEQAPTGVKPLEWLLLTTVPVDTFEQAIEKLQWYARRWGIEVLHRTLKSGCRIEQTSSGNWVRPIAWKPAWPSIWWWLGASSI